MNEYFVKIYYVPAMYKALCWAQREYKYGSLIYSIFIGKVTIIHIRNNPKGYTNIQVQTE